MTDKEKLSEEEFKLAEEVIKTIYRKAIKNDYSFARYGVECYQAGLKASRPQWHILAEEPNIMPKEGQKVKVLTEEGIIEESTLFYDTYYEELAWSNIGFIKVFAWCEIPKYTEE